jgi:hypothetical protein
MAGAGMEISSVGLQIFNPYDQHIYSRPSSCLLLTLALEFRLSKATTSFKSLYAELQGVLHRGAFV